MHVSPTFVKSEISYRNDRVRAEVRAARRDRARRRRDRGIGEERGLG